MVLNFIMYDTSNQCKIITGKTFANEVLSLKVLVLSPHEVSKISDGRALLLGKWCQILFKVHITTLMVNGAADAFCLSSKSKDGARAFPSYCYTIPSHHKITRTDCRKASKNSVRCVKYWKVRCSNIANELSRIAFTIRYILLKLRIILESHHKLM